MLKRIADLKLFIRKRGKRQFCKEVLIALILLSMPFWFLIFDIIPETQVFETEWFLLDAGALGFDYVDFMIWTIVIKLIPLTVLVLWFATCKYWWRLVILVPLVFAIAQFVHLFISERYIDDGEFLLAFLIALPIMSIFTWVIQKINSYNLSAKLIDTVDKELIELFNRASIKKRNQDFGKYIEKFQDLKKQRLVLSSEHYLYEIIALKNQLVLAENSVESS